MEVLKRKILNYFKDLEFKSKSHTYKVKDKVLAKTVSGLASEFAIQTDFTQKATEKDHKLKLPKGSTKKLWNFKRDISALFGSKIHFFGELYMFNRNVEPSDNYEKAVVKFWKELPEHIVPFLCELKMYHKKFFFGGTTDIVLYNTLTGKFILADYKTNEDLFKNFKGQRLQFPFEHLLDNSFNKFQIQLAYYQILFEQTGYEIEDRIVIHIKGDGTYDMYSTENLSETLILTLKKGLLQAS